MLEHIPTIEERLHNVERTLSLGILLTRALTSAGDLCLEIRDKELAFGKVNDVLCDALDSLRAATAALPTATTLINAPEVK
jgi:hypothetical protein